MHIQRYLRKRVTLLSFTFFLLVTFSETAISQTVPVLLYKIGFGAGNLRGGFPLASSVDSVGNTYIAGSRTNRMGPECADVSVQKVDPSGTNLIYRLTVNTCGFVRAMASDSNGYAYVLLFDSSITRISPDGSEIINAWASPAGANDLVISSGDHLFVAGAWNGDAFASELDLASGNTVWRQPFGGGAGDFATGLAVDSSENVFVTGRTQSIDFPTINAAQDHLQGNTDAFVVKVDASGSSLIYSTYLGGDNNDEPVRPAVDDAGHCYVTGVTSSQNFPTVNALQASLNGGTDAFVTKVSADGGSLLFSTFLGGSAAEEARSVTFDSLDNVYVTGMTMSSDYPLQRASHATFEGNWQAFLSRLNSAGSAFVYSTYESGGTGNFHQGYNLAADASDNIYLTIQTHSFFGGGDNDGAELSKFAANQSPVANAGSDRIIDAASPMTSVTLDATGSSDAEGDPLTYVWKNEAGDTVGTTPQVVLALAPGQYTFDLIVSDTSGAQSTDSVVITVRDVPAITITSPTQTTYLIDANVIASYSCSDPGGSTVVTCTGSVPNGSAVSTSTAGAKTFTVTATNALANTATSSVNYNVTYKIFLMYNSTSAFNAKPKLQLKVQLQNVASLNRSSSTLAVTALRVTPRNNPNVTVRTLSGNFLFDPNLNFQGSAPGGGYKYEFDATGMSTGNYDLLFSVAGDPVPHVAPFAIK